MTFVTKQNQFQEICDLISDKKIAAIDTEFIRRTTDLPVLCLIQINVDEKCYVIDALSNLDLSPFVKILSDQKIIKIFHSARQDMEVLLLNFRGQINLQEVFDTQIMASLCGLGFNISYSNLVKNLLDQNVAKDWQRSNWQRRPLHNEQIEYAKIDVLHLPQIYQILLKELSKKKKLDWAKDEMKLNIEKATKDYLRQNIKAEMMNLLGKKGALELKEKKPKTTFRLDESQKEIYQQSRILLQDQAKKHLVNPELIINQNNLQNLILGYKSIAEILPGWRYIVFGAELEKLFPA